MSPPESPTNTQGSDDVGFPMAGDAAMAPPAPNVLRTAPVAGSTEYSVPSWSPTTIRGVRTNARFPTEGSPKGVPDRAVDHTTEPSAAFRATRVFPAATATRAGVVVTGAPSTWMMMAPVPGSSPYSPSDPPA